MDLQAELESLKPRPKRLVSDGLRFNPQLTRPLPLAPL